MDFILLLALLSVKGINDGSHAWSSVMSLSDSYFGEKGVACKFLPLTHIHSVSADLLFSIQWGPCFPVGNCIPQVTSGTYLPLTHGLEEEESEPWTGKTNSLE